MMMGGDMGRMMQMMQGRMAASPGPVGMQHYRRIEGRLAFIRAELRITDAQAAPWNTFADAVRSQTERLGQAAMPTQAPGQPSAAPPTALQQMERRIAALSEQLEAMRAVAAAAGPLYAALSEEQRRTADELMIEHGRGMRMGRMY
ncbi:Spy/CpxP family protein refolding chaperone [Elioraea rosea]|uniref:Spy/CpxP family protein refolding chaperone n=1 Tax=Elioraea rosea TaxID=2492390 RepID=UPI00131595F7|nr:Spy/CpxP family protein refolding chaperone [Elioraea rosea]